jgi:hypothetical protein
VLLELAPPIAVLLELAPPMPLEDEASVDVSSASPQAAVTAATQKAVVRSWVVRIMLLRNEGKS